MLKELIKTKEWIIDILWPKKCLGCGREGLYICKDCEIFLSEVDPTMAECLTLKVKRSATFNVKHSQNIVSVWEYEGLMEKLIQKIKYDGCYDIVGELVAMAFKKIDLNLPENTIITFVPMYKKREKQRGFNQAELFAKKVGEMTNRPVRKLLEKIKDNRSQVGLSPQERAENVKGVFRIRPNLTSEVNGETSEVDEGLPRNALIVDDVYTTGATMQECIKTLKKAGVKNVWGFTLSRKMSIQNY